MFFLSLYLLQFKKTKTGWNKKNLSSGELDQIEGQYLNLASYSNKLIRANKKSKKQQAAKTVGGLNER